MTIVCFGEMYLLTNYLHCLVYFVAKFSLYYIYKVNTVMLLLKTHNMMTTALCLNKCIDE